MSNLRDALTSLRPRPAVVVAALAAAATTVVRRLQLAADADARWAEATSDASR